VGSPPSADNQQPPAAPEAGRGRRASDGRPPSSRPRKAAQATSAARRVARARRRKASGRRLFAFDRELGCRYVAGADEAGRGSLAGPLVAAAVLFDLERLTLSDRRALSRLNDSKQHTAETREELYPLVLRAAARSVIVSRCVRGIDSRGLHNTNLEALRTALLGVARPEGICLVDGFNVPEFGFEQRAVIDGDCRSAAIAAASVLAKVSRDRYMKKAAVHHTDWDFDTNVGYSTPEHRAAIAEHGISPLHRLSFQSIAYNQLALEESEAELGLEPGALGPGALGPGAVDGAALEAGAAELG
jgi:ribonuclease HII